MKGMLKKALAGVAAAALAVTGLAVGASTASAAVVSDDYDSSKPTLTVSRVTEGSTYTAYLLGSYKNAVADGDCVSSVDLEQSTAWTNPTIAQAANTATNNDVPTEYAGNELAYMTTSDVTAAQLRTFASELTKNDPMPNAAGSATAGKGDSQVTITVPTEGWYLVTETVVDEEGNATTTGSPLLVGTYVTVAGDDDDTTYDCLTDSGLGSAVAKPSTPGTPEKKVLDANGNPVDSVSALVGSTVTFQVTTYVPNYTGYEQNYTWTVEDTPGTGLTINTSTVKVTVNSTTLNNTQEKTYYTATVSNGVLTITFNDVADNFTVNDTVVITYEATVGEGAIVTTDNQNGAVNSVKVNHNGSESGTGTATVKSYAFSFTKVDADTMSLNGAKFTVKYGNKYLAYDSTNGVYVFQDGPYYFTGVDGVFSFSGVPAGDYVVEETTVPDGMLQSVKAKFTVTIGDDGTVSYVEDGGLGLVSGTYGQGTGIRVLNVSSITQLPQTGAAGIALFVVLGLLIAGAGVTVWMKSRSVRNAING